MVLRALRNEPRFVARAPVKILEVEPKIVEAVGDALKDRVPRDLRKLLVKSRIEDAKTNWIVLHSGVRSDNSLKLDNVGSNGLGCRPPDNFDLYDTAAIERIPKVGFGKRKIEVERRQ